MEIPRRIAAPCRRRILIAGLKTFVTGPGLEQRAIHREVFVRQQPLRLRVQEDGLKEHRGDVAREQPIAVLTERCRRPDRIVDPQPDKPPKQQVVIQLLHQLPLAANRIQRLQQQGPQQLLRRHRRPAELDIQRAKLGREPLERTIGDVPDGPQRMVRRDPVLQRHIAEHRSGLLVGSTHRLAPFRCGSMVVRGDPYVDPLSLTFSATC